MSKTVFVGMSGGVDSSVTAYLMQKQGFNVVGVYMKNWAKDIPGFNCPWEEDLTDADAVAAQLGIELKVFDLQKDYYDLVVSYMLDGYKSGLTPNPDVMCNEQIKFKLFLELSLQAGANMIATGHYAVTKNGLLYRGEDDSKDQSYFLYRVTQAALQKSLFPLGQMNKTEVRRIAKQQGLITADKKDSVGICFVGKVPIKQFLAQYVEIKTGPIVDQNKLEVGQHEGAILYTIGQRKGLGVGGGLPYYVTGKDLDTNTVFVTTDLDDSLLWSESVDLTNLNWIGESPVVGQALDIQVRYRSKSVGCEVVAIDENSCTVKLKSQLKAVAPGQSGVIYDNNRVVGGGIIV